MQRAIQLELGLSSVPEPADVADALAIAFCHFCTRREIGGQMTEVRGRGVEY